MTLRLPRWSLLEWFMNVAENILTAHRSPFQSIICTLSFVVFAPSAFWHFPFGWTRYSRPNLLQVTFKLHPCRDTSFLAFIQVRSEFPESLYLNSLFLSHSSSRRTLSEAFILQLGCLLILMTYKLRWNDAIASIKRKVENAIGAAQNRPKRKNGRRAWKFSIMLSKYVG